MSFENANTRRLVLEGVDESWGAELPAALNIVDMRWDPEGYWYNMPGFVRVDDVSNGVDGEVLWLQWFSPKGARERYLMCEVAVTTTTSKLGYIDLSDGSFVTVQASRRRTRHPWPGINTLEHNGWLYLMDGSNLPVRWAPDQPLTPIGFPSRPGPMTVVSGDKNSGVPIFDYAGSTVTHTGASGEVVSTPYAQQRGLGSDTSEARFEYVYAFTVFNDQGQESPRSPLATVAGNTGEDTAASGVGAKRGVFYSIPRQPAWTRGGRLWRSKDQHDTVPLGTPPLYLVTEFHHSWGFEAIDFAMDEELLEQLAETESGTMPPTLVDACIWSETLFGITQDATTVIYSTAGLIEQIPFDNTLPLATATSGPLTSIHAAPRGVIVFAERAVFIIKATADLRFYGQPLVTGIGSLSGRAVVEIPRVGFAFLDPQAGPQAIVGSLDDDTQTNVVPIAQEVRRKWMRRVNREALSQARAVLDPVAREVWWQLPEGGSQKQSLGIVYHYEANGWSFREGWPIGDLDYDRGLVWFGGQASQVGIYAVTPNATDKAGVAFTCTYDTQWMTFGQERGMIMRTHWWVIGTGDGELQVSTRIERRNEYVAQFEAGRIPTSMPTECEPEQWGTGVWGTGVTFAEHMPTVIPVSVDARVGLEHQVRLQSPATTDLRVLGLQVEVPVPSFSPDFEEG